MDELWEHNAAGAAEEIAFHETIEIMAEHLVSLAKDEIGDFGWCPLCQRITIDFADEADEIEIEYFEAYEDCYGRDAYCYGDCRIDDAWEQGDYPIDGVGFADPGGGSALRAETSNNPRNLPCPSCGKPNRLTPLDRQAGYQCDECADAAKRGY